MEDLLLLARSDSGAVTLDRVPLHLDDVAAEAAAALAQPAAAAGVRVEVDPEPAATVGDPARLRQLVMILVDNAIRHSPRDAAVRVIVRATPAATTVAVEDAGPGVRPEDRERVFDRFWRAPGAPAGGTGLGLAIAKWIAEHHDGSISVDDSAAGGARFEVRLPAQSTNHGGRPVSASRNPRASRAIVVAVVVIGLAAAGGLAYLLLRPAAPAAVGLGSAPPGGSQPAASIGTLPSGAASSLAPGDLAGTWTIDPSIGSFSDFSSSFVGYRVDETLGSIGANTAVGRGRPRSAARSSSTAPRSRASR